MPVKQFESRQEAQDFIDGLPPCGLIGKRFNAIGFVTVTWRQIRLHSMDDGRMHPVTRETTDEYLTRNEGGEIIKVCRRTLMCGGKRFELE